VALIEVIDVFAIEALVPNLTKGTNCRKIGGAWLSYYVLEAMLQPASCEFIVEVAGDSYLRPRNV
jgi:hypothetical protein